MIDIFVAQEKEHEADIARLNVGELPEADLTLSPLVLPSRFVNEEFMATLDPYGSNIDLIGSETASQLQTPNRFTGDRMADHREEIPVKINSGVMPLGSETKAAPLVVRDPSVGENADTVREEELAVSNPEGPLEISDFLSDNDEEGSQKDHTPVRVEELNPLTVVEEDLPGGALEQNLEVDEAARSEGRDAGTPDGSALVPSTGHVGNFPEPDARGEEDGTTGFED